jgi:hypothetical protein
MPSEQNLDSIVKQSMYIAPEENKMKHKLLIGVTMGLLLAFGLGTVSFANLSQSAIVSSIDASTLHQTAPDCKYPPCD